MKAASQGEWAWKDLPAPQEPLESRATRAIRARPACRSAPIPRRNPLPSRTPPTWLRPDPYLPFSPALTLTPHTQSHIWVACMLYRTHSHTRVALNAHIPTQSLRMLHSLAAQSDPRLQRKGHAHLQRVLLAYGILACSARTLSCNLHSLVHTHMQSARTHSQACACTWHAHVRLPCARARARAFVFEHVRVRVRVRAFACA